MSYHLEQAKRHFTKAYLSLSKSYEAVVKIKQELELLKTIQDEFWKIRIDFLEKERIIQIKHHIAMVYDFLYARKRLEIRMEDEREWLVNRI